jgi:two-component system response regulator AtoC
MAAQERLLRAVEYGEVTRIGSSRAIKVDVRIVAATNRDLPAMVREGRFREDLYFRLSVFQIAMPPLRERRDDIPGLIRFILAQQGSSGGPLAIDPEAEDLLLHFGWPGNVRQLENVLHRAAILADGGRIRVGDLPPEVSRMVAAQGRREAAAGGTTLRERVRAFELKLILQAIEEANGDRRLAAQRLGIGLSSLYRKLEEYPAEAVTR